jgi:hypothetical protein
MRTVLSVSLANPIERLSATILIEFHPASGSGCTLNHDGVPGEAEAIDRRAARSIRANTEEVCAFETFP